MNLPQAKKDNLLTTQLEDEVVVYDPERKQAHSLNRTALAVWNHSDGQTSMADLQRRVSSDVGAPVSEAAVWLALRKLERAHLLAENLASTEPMTRRHILGQAGRLGAAAMLATPIVISASVPAAAAFCSTCGTNPTTGGKCICGESISACIPNVPPAPAGSHAVFQGVCYDSLAASPGTCTKDLDCTTSFGAAYLCVANASAPDHVCAGACRPVCPQTPGCDACPTIA